MYSVSTQLVRTKRKRKECLRTIGMGGIEKYQMGLSPPTIEVKAVRLSSMFPLPLLSDPLFFLFLTILQDATLSNYENTYLQLFL
jgi:hypothetical protein